MERRAMGRYGSETRPVFIRALVTCAVQSQQSQHRFCMKPKNHPKDELEVSHKKPVAWKKKKKQEKACAAFPGTCKSLQKNQPQPQFSEKINLMQGVRYELCGLAGEAAVDLPLAGGVGCELELPPSPYFQFTLGTHR